MTKSTDPADMSRDQRIGELASILARGIIRVFEPDSKPKTALKIQARNLSKKP